MSPSLLGVKTVNSTNTGILLGTLASFKPVYYVRETYQ